MKSATEEIAIPPDTVQKWQRIVDLLADIIQVPSAVVCKLEPPFYSHYKILASNQSEENPFPIGDTFSMDIGTFCETVIKSREPLLVVNALEDDRWQNAPEIKFGMVSYLGFPVLWPDGRMVGTICVLDNKANPYSDRYKELLSHFCEVLQADLETLVRLSDELEDQRAHLSELFARVPEAAVVISRDFQIKQVNPAFTELFGYSAEEAIGHDVKVLIAPESQDEKGNRFLSRLFDSEEAFDFDAVCSRKNGTAVPIAAIFVPIPLNDNSSAGYLICRDMTETKRFEEEQRRFQKIELELANANRVATLAQLSASIAHELNQPLTGIIANCSTSLKMMTKDPLDVFGAQEAVRRTMRDGHRASEVVERLRELFRNKGPEFVAVDLNEAAREMIALSSSDIQKCQVILRTELADQLPFIFADRIQLQQVILNLLRNALDAMSTVDDRPRDLLIETLQAEDNFVKLRVKDVGAGIDPKIMTKIFDAFFTTKDAGMGVGLAVSRSIIEKHNGLIQATLNDGPGATFEFAIPAQGRIS